jgi:hypothetical protein
MIQAANHWQFDDLALVGWFDRARLGTIGRQRAVRAVAMIIVDVLAEPATQVLLVKHNEAV